MFRSLLYAGGSTFARLLSGAGLMIFVARVIGPHDFGLMALLMTVATVLALIVDFGHNTYVMRELALVGDQRKSLLADMFATKAVLAIFYFVACTATAIVMQLDQRAAIGFALLSLMAFSGAIADFINACFRGIEKFEVETKNVFIASGLHVAIVLPTTVIYEDWVHVAGAFFVSRSCYLLISQRAFKVHFDFPPIHSLGIYQIKYALSRIGTTFSYAIDAGLVTVRGSLDVFIISSSLGNNAVGIYQAGMSLIKAVENVGPIFANVFLPRLASTLGQSEQFAKYVALLFGSLVGAGGAVFLFCNFVPDLYWTLLFGDKYVGMGDLFPVFGLYLFARFVAMAAGVVLTAYGAQLGRAIGGVVSIASVFAASAVLIPLCGVVGAAAAQVFATIVLIIWFACQFKVLSKNHLLWVCMISAFSLSAILAYKIGGL